MKARWAHTFARSMQRFMRLWFFCRSLLQQAQGGENWKNIEATIFPFKESKYVKEK